MQKVRQKESTKGSKGMEDLQLGTNNQESTAAIANVPALMSWKRELWKKHILKLVRPKLESSTKS